MRSSLSHRYTRAKPFWIFKHSSLQMWTYQFGETLVSFSARRSTRATRRVNEYWVQLWTSAMMVSIRDRVAVILSPVEKRWPGSRQRDVLRAIQLHFQQLFVGWEIFPPRLLHRMIRWQTSWVEKSISAGGRCIFPPISFFFRRCSFIWC